MIKHIPDDFIPIEVLESELWACNFAIQHDMGTAYDRTLSSALSILLDWIKEPCYQKILNYYCFSVEKNSEFSVLKHGYWTVGYFHDRVCSCCLRSSNDLSEHPFDFCPWCGAKMDK